MRNKPILAVILTFLLTAAVFSQTTEFTYQGSLKDGANPANGNYDFEFVLYDSLTGGSQVGVALARNSVAVSAGTFAVKLDFGSQFPGANRFLEIHVRQTGGGGFTPLTPRQLVNSAPYSVKSLTSDTAVNAANATTANNALNLGGVAASQYTVNGQNIINAGAQFNIGGVRVFSIAGTDNVFAGINAGDSNTTGSRNAFFGRSSGFNNTTGTNNSFFGFQSGNQTTTGVENSFFGSKAGFLNTGDQNAFFGSQAGQANTTGTHNSFFGSQAGTANTIACCNAFIGTSAGFNSNGSFNTFVGDGTAVNNTTGPGNTFVGFQSGGLNETGGYNVAVGTTSGSQNRTGTYNTFIGTGSGVNTDGLDHATAIGANSIVTTSNTITLGRFDGSDTVNIPGKLQVNTLGTAGATSLCINGSNRIASCSSSLRYKTQIASYHNGLNMIGRLRPISFAWKDGGLRDVGFGAEDVAKIEPLLVTYNAKGEIEGVKYAQITTLLVNAAKEQQEQIEAQKKQIDQQRTEIEGLKRLICHRSRAKVCRTR